MFKKDKYHIAVSGLALSFVLHGTIQAQTSETEILETVVTADDTAPQEVPSLKLRSTSPYNDPDMMYLEADELQTEDDNNVMIAVGNVSGRYQDRSLRADKVIYNLDTGEVLAIGNVAIIDSTGSSQFADKVQLSGELEAGTASDFTARLETGGISGAAFAERQEDGSLVMYNAYYTACEACEGQKRPVSWQLNARKITQDPKRRMVHYRDAFVKVLGIPVLYTPYLAHPDPTQDRASGFLMPYAGVSGQKGVNTRTPYYWAIDDYSELTVTPHLYSKINPMLGYEYKRKFYSGELNIYGGVTYGGIFDRDGNDFTDKDEFNNPDLAPIGKRWRSLTYADGLFNITPTWKWGFGVQASSDDRFRERYDLDPPNNDRGIYSPASNQHISQIFAVGQDDDFRASASAYGFQSLITRIVNETREGRTNLYRISQQDDGVLPIVAPKLNLQKYYTDPVLRGRLELSSDVTHLTRKVGTDYTHGSLGVDWTKSYYTNNGLDVRPFAAIRYDNFDFKTDDSDGQIGVSQTFDRTVGQGGLDMRLPLVRSFKNFEMVVEPRAQLTHNFGDGKNDKFSVTNEDGDQVNLLQDSLEIDLDTSLLWSANKSTGYNFWQEGTRLDVGTNVTALWQNSSASAFLGRSFASNTDDRFAETTGLATDTSDIVGGFDLNLNGQFSLNSQVRYDDENSKFRRLDTGFTYAGDRITTGWRYYKIDSAADENILNTPGLNGDGFDELATTEELRGSVGLTINDNWSARYNVTKDIDQDILRQQELGLIFSDNCTEIEFIYNKREYPNDATRDDEGFGIRLNLATLGSFRDN